MAKLDIDAEYVAKLAELLQRTGLTEIEITEGDARIRVAKKIKQTVEYASPPQTGAVAMPVAAPATPSAASDESARNADHPGMIKSPMVGTVYLAPDPSSPSFVSIGEDVREGQTLLIIEAMKVMNSIRAPRSGKVIKVFVENATPVEFGEPLLIIE
ncbi:MAG: acetyl-CoA carboxylase biotin carboxyl carrier protein [Geminicoccaceae bacterium]|nr:acetyl-CoA carboxylase biotin carboxyl carrier protein [Geminicoccaceae bacterium]MCB9942621.1 acetyl-CoA carboxylase biotin carboxyl carrier protein [Geminicoccaceae bacterium]